MLGLIDCLETSVIDYYHSLRNKPKERSSHLLGGGSPKSHLHVQYLYKYYTTVTCVKEAKRNTRYQVNENTVKKNQTFIGKQYVIYNALHVSAQNNHHHTLHKGNNKQRR